MKAHVCISYIASLVLMVAELALAGPDTGPSKPSVDDGVVMEQRIVTEMPGLKMPPQTLVIKTKDRRVRINVGTIYSTVTLRDGSGLMIDHMGRSATKSTMSASQLKEGLEQRESDAATPYEKPKLVATGKKLKIGAYEADAYTLTSAANGQKTTITQWYVPNYPDADRINDLLKTFQETNTQTKLTRQFFPDIDFKDLPKGFVIRTESDMPGGGKVTVDIISAKVIRIDDAEFEVPKGYKTTEMPKFPIGK